MDKWKTVLRPGYMGNARERLREEWDKRYGVDNWRLAWSFGELTLDLHMALQVYEDGYFCYLKDNLSIVHWLTITGSDVYDTAESNIESGFSYSIQETLNNHYHDIAIRRSVARLGMNFRGDHLVWVRGEDSEGYCLNPGKVPFHMSCFINKEPFQNLSGKNKWWDKDSIEDFWQSNKVLQVKNG